VEAGASRLFTSLPRNAAVAKWCHADARVLPLASELQWKQHSRTSTPRPKNGLRQRAASVLQALAVCCANNAAEHFTDPLQQSQLCHKTCFLK